jgi:hypothetical protein
MAMLYPCYINVMTEKQSGFVTFRVNRSDGFRDARLDKFRRSTRLPSRTEPGQVFGWANMRWTIVRWGLALALAAFALVQFNDALSGARQTAAPPGFQYPEAWAYQARKAFGLGVAILAGAALIMINLRRGWPYVKSKWTALLFIVAVLGVAWPQAQHFWDVDACLDRGGSWDHMSQTCRT